MGLFRRDTKPPLLSDEIAELQKAVVGARLDEQVTVTFMSPKGGVGKTVTAAAVAHILSERRAETTAIVDGNPHTGTLRRRLVSGDIPLPASMLQIAQRALVGEASSDWRWLHTGADRVGRLWVFSNDAADPGAVEAMTGEEYGAFLDVVSAAAQITVQDMGTSTVGPIARAALDATDTLVFVTDLTQDALEETIEFVSALAGQPMSYADTPSTDYTTVSDGRYARLVRKGVVAVNPSRDHNRDQSDMDGMLDWLRQVVGAPNVVLIPHASELASGDVIDWSKLPNAATRSYLELTSLVAERFPVSKRRSNPYLSVVASGY